MNFITYTFKPYFGLFIAILSVIAVALLTAFYLTDSFVLFLCTIFMYAAIIATVITGSYWNYCRYVDTETTHKMRSLHNNWKR